MAEIKPKIEGLNIVLRGSFNPQIFQPAWFAAEGLIRKEEADSAKVQVIHPEVTVFSLDWGQVQVTHDLFSAESSTNQRFSPELIRDLTVGTFRLLRHTPVTMMGLNRFFHFPITSMELWHSVGHKLAPKEHWRDLLQEPGTRSLTIQGVRPDGLKGLILVKIEPSIEAHPGVFVHVNDHFEAQATAPVQGATELIGILEKSWKESLERSRKIAYSLVSKLACI